MVWVLAIVVLTRSACAMQLACPHCQAVVNVPEGLLEGKVRCQQCQGVVTIPAAADVARGAVAPEQGIRSGAKPPGPPAVVPVLAAHAAPMARPVSPTRSGMSPLVIALVAGGLVASVFLIGCLGGVYWLLMRSAPARLDNDTFSATVIDGPRFPAAAPEVPAADEPPLPAFPDPPNPYRAGTQTKLREVGTFKAPGNVVQLTYSPKHELLFIRNSGTGIWVIDVKNQKDLGMQNAREQFYDMGLSADESVMFAADYGGESVGYKTPIRPHHVHRYDLAKRTWERRIPPKIAGRLKTVDANHVLLLERDQWVDVTLNRWEANQERVTEVARAHAGRVGDIVYNPRTGLLYHSGFEINVLRVRGESLTKVPGDAPGTMRSGGGNITLAADGKYLYLGAAQIEALDVQHTVESMPEPILAASRDLAFGAGGYYETKGAKPAGTLGFRCTAYDVDIHSMHLWAYDSGTGTLHHYRIEGDK
jgi:hypothetical protein